MPIEILNKAVLSVHVPFANAPGETECAFYGPGGQVPVRLPPSGHAMQPTAPLGIAWPTSYAAGFASLDSNGDGVITSSQVFGSAGAVSVTYRYTYAYSTPLLSASFNSSAVHRRVSLVRVL